MKLKMVHVILEGFCSLFRYVCFCPYYQLCLLRDKVHYKIVSFLLYNKNFTYSTYIHTYIVVSIRFK